MDPACHSAGKPDYGIGKVKIQARLPGFNYSHTGFSFLFQALWSNGVMEYRKKLSVHCYFAA